MAELLLGLALALTPPEAEVVTWYPHVGVTYCGQLTAEMAEPWLAAPLAAFERGDVACGDLVGLWTEGSDGERHYTQARIQDAGPFGAYCVRQPDGACWPIRYDVPEVWWPHGRDLSARVVEVHEISKMANP